MELHSVGTTVPITCWALKPVIHAGSSLGVKTSGLPYNRISQSHPGLCLCQTSKTKQCKVLSDCWEEILKNGSQCPHQVRNLRIKEQPVTRRRHTGLMRWPTLQKGQGVLHHFPAVHQTCWVQTGVDQTLHGNSASTGVWVPAFDCHRAGRLPPGSHSQEAVHSCWSLVTPYPGGGSISMVKQQIPRLWWWLQSSIDRNCVIISHIVNPFQFQWSSNG